MFTPINRGVYLMEGIRIIGLPEAKMVTSGNQNINEFDQWFTEVNKTRKDPFFPRDFMWFDKESDHLVWYYALPEGLEDTNGYEVVHFPGWLYAAAVCEDENDVDSERVYKGILEWIQESCCFELDERPGHYTLFHVITPDAAYQVMGYRQLDIFVPIKVIE